MLEMEKKWFKFGNKEPHEPLGMVEGTILEQNELIISLMNRWTC